MFALKVIGEILLCPINYQIVKTQIYSHWNVHEKLPLNTNFHLFLYDLFSSVGCINAAECFCIRIAYLDIKMQESLLNQMQVLDVFQILTTGTFSYPK